MLGLKSPPDGGNSRFSDPQPLVPSPVCQGFPPIRPGYCPLEIQLTLHARLSSLLFRGLFAVFWEGGGMGAPWLSGFLLLLLLLFSL